MTGKHYHQGSQQYEVLGVAGKKELGHGLVGRMTQKNQTLYAADVNNVDTMFEHA
jgi:hypothetical protein